MTGLVLTLKAHEKFLVNGALLINGPKRSQIRIRCDDVNVLRLSDALHPDEVTTPVRRVYYAAQLFLSGDANACDIREDIKDGLSALEHVFEGTPLEPQIQKSQKAVDAGRYYSLLCALRPLLVLEAQLLNISPPSNCNSDPIPQLPARKETPSFTRSSVAAPKLLQVRPNVLPRRDEGLAVLESAS